MTYSARSPGSPRTSSPSASSGWSGKGCCCPALLGAAAPAAYQLTAEGTELAGALRLLAHWGARHADPAEAPRYPACGTLLEACWYCPTRDHLVDHEPRDAEVSYL